MYVNTSIVSENLSKLERKQQLDLYYFVGYTALVVNFDYSPSKNFRALLTEMQIHQSLKLYGKILIHPKTQKGLKNALKTLNSYRDFLISVQSKDKDILTFAINDSRIDTVSCSSISDLSFITPGIISLLKTNKKHLEFSLKDVIIGNTHDRSRLFHEMSKFLSLISNNIHLLLYGGCEESLYEIRGPHEIATIFTAIFDLSTVKSKSIVQSNPELLINNLLERGKEPHLPNGVKIKSIENKE